MPTLSGKLLKATLLSALLLVAHLPSTQAIRGSRKNKRDLATLVYIDNEDDESDEKNEKEPKVKVSKESRTKGNVITYFESSENLATVGSGDALGDMRIWYKNPIYDEDNNPLGYETGNCKVVNVDPEDSFCMIQVTFESGEYAGSDIMYQGLSSRRQVVIGGTGEFAGKTGESAYTSTPDGRTFVHVIRLDK